MRAHQRTRARVDLHALPQRRSGRSARIRNFADWSTPPRPDTTLKWGVAADPAFPIATNDASDSGSWARTSTQKYQREGDGVQRAARIHPTVTATPSADK